jgi:hypothetical protein
MLIDSLPEGCTGYDLGIICSLEWGATNEFIRLVFSTRNNYNLCFVKIVIQMRLLYMELIKVYSYVFVRFESVNSKGFKRNYTTDFYL